MYDNKNFKLNNFTNIYLLEPSLQPTSKLLIGTFNFFLYFDAHAHHEGVQNIRFEYIGAAVNHSSQALNCQGFQDGGQG